MIAVDSPLRWREFSGPEALATMLARNVAEPLRQAIVLRGAASLAVSGGTTPKRFFAALSAENIDWAKVSITLVDERWVDKDSERSNARLVRETLLQGLAAAARFVPLYDAAFATPEAALPALTQRLRALPQPFDVVLLGMGADGHFASLFPGGDHLAQGLDPNTPQLLIAMHAAAAGEPRISLTLPPILAARQAILHIEGAAKRATLERALDGDVRLPIHALLQARTPFLPCYWCP